MDNNEVEKTNDMQSQSQPQQQKTDKRERRESSKQTREYVMEFIEPNTRIAVRVQRTQAFRPYYSFVVGRVVQHENGESFVPFVPIRSETQHAKVTSVQDHSKLIAGLIADATEWVSKQLQAREDEIIEMQQKRESEKFDRFPQSKPGLKQLSKIERVAKTYT